MIVWKSKKVPETREGFPCSAFRKVVAIGWFYIEYTNQHLYKEKWYYSHTNTLSIELRSKFEIGDFHTYYDGPHCMLSLGFLKINYSGISWNRGCSKCER